MRSITLLPERASLGESSSSSCWLTKNSLTITTYHHCLRVAKHYCYVETALAFDIHEERIWRLDKTFEFVLLLLKLCWRIQQIDIVLENHFWLAAKCSKSNLKKPQSLGEAADLTKYQIGVNIYAFSDKYTDIASLGTLAKYTGGQVYYYPSFQSNIHGEKLRCELARDLTRETAWEAVMRIRCGKGIRFTSYHGNFMLRSTDLLALPAVDCDKAYAMQLSLEETLLSTPTVYFQVALLYTASCGERRIRVHTAAAPVVTDLGEMYRQADTGAIVSLFCRLAIEKTLTSKLEDARNSLQQRIVKALREYRNLYAVRHRLGARMIYPESLKFLCLYGLALSKSVPLKGGYADAQLDERCAAGFTMMALPVKKLLKLLYPSLIRIDEYLLKPSAQADDFKNIMKRLPLLAESLDSRGLYLYDDGLRFVIWFGRMLSPDIARNLLGPEFAAELSRVALTENDNEMSRRLMKMLKRLRESDPSYYQLPYLVRQGEQPREGFLLLVNLLEDQMGGTVGYVDWIMQIHRQVQQNA